MKSEQMIMMSAELAFLSQLYVKKEVNDEEYALLKKAILRDYGLNTLVNINIECDKKNVYYNHKGTQMEDEPWQM